VISDMSTRYFYYLILMMMLSNLVAYVPKFLLSERLDGSVLAMIVSLPTGMIFMFLHVKLYQQFPGMSLPEIVKKYLPKWVGKIFLGYMGIMWFIAGFILLAVITDITSEFIAEEMKRIYIISMYVLLTASAALMKSKKILYSVEIILLLNFPLLAFVLLKAYFNEEMNWDSAKLTLTHIWELPSWSTFSAAAFIFIGYANLAVFNKYIKHLHLKWYWFAIVAAGGLFTFLGTFAVPIGFLGVDGIEDYTHPGLSAADALRVEFGFIERAMFIVLILYLNIALLNIVLLWHVGTKLLKSILKDIVIKRNNITNVCIMGAFASLAIFLTTFMNDYYIYIVAKTWFSILIPAQVLAIVTLYWAYRRKKR
jgi:spore germination protein KB